jgi:hypothetical protein
MFVINDPMYKNQPAIGIGGRRRLLKDVDGAVPEQFSGATPGPGLSVSRAST